MDGTLGSQTARLLDGSGVKITGREELAEIVRAGVRAGWPVAVHAIGDLANREALDAFEETREEWAPLGLRQRIEHAQLLAEEDVGRFAELGVAASVQFSHAPSDRDLADRIWKGNDRPCLRLSLARRVRSGGRERLGCADRGARSAGRHLRRGAAHARRARRLAPGAGSHDRAGAGGDDPRARLARPRRAAPRQAPPRLPRRPRRARPGPARRFRRRSYPTFRSSRRCSAAAGCTTRHPGTDSDYGSSASEV